MPKVMLVEDDNNLREIYDARLAAEGYEIVSAHDGEEALALAVKERPDLIISDVMMPKISGFDMLDILRSTPETKNVKVIMMTALSQAEDRARADKLGADRYLIKSQVTLEDVIKVAHEVLNDVPAQDAPAAAEPMAATPVKDVPVVAEPTPASTIVTAEPVATPPAPVPTVEEPDANPTPEEPTTTVEPIPPTATEDAEKQIQDFLANTPAAPVAEEPAASTNPQPTAEPVITEPEAPQIKSGQAAIDPQDKLTNPQPTAVNAADSPEHKKLVLTPTESALSPSVDLDALLKKEEESAAATVPETQTIIAPSETPAGDANPNDIAL